MSIELASHSGVRSWPWCRPVVVRAAGGEHRQCTPLELLFDLCFVVSIAVLVMQLHHAIASGYFWEGAVRYTVLLVPICWAWVLFSWFATMYDNDDVIYRLLTFGQMAGLLALTATIPAAFEGEPRPFIVCYVLMRIPLVIKWMRAARHRVEEHGYAGRHVIGLMVCQLGWLASVIFPASSRPVIFSLLVGLELAVPLWAAATAAQQVIDPRHISERFGLFTMIVIGESMTASAHALRKSIELHGTAPMVAIAIATLLSAFCVWWLYFDVLDGDALTLDQSCAFRWTHGHQVAFWAISGMGAAAEIALQVQAGELAFSLPMRLAVVIPTALSVLALAWIQSLTADAAPFITVTRVSAGLVILIGGVLAGGDGPMAAAAVVTGVLLVQAVVETTMLGRRLRRARPAMS